MLSRPDISIILPSIRPDNLKDVLNSIEESTIRNFEVIIISPYELPDNVKKSRKIKYIRDFGSPVRCSNIGGALAEGKTITHAADDCIFIKDSLDKNLDIFYEMGNSKSNVIISPYQEGDNEVYNSDYFKINTHYRHYTPFIPEEWLLFNTPIMSAEFFSLLGGLDCSFLTTAVAHVDMSIRAQKEGSNVKLSKYPIFKCSQMINETGDHGPIHRATINHDIPLFKKIYGELVNGKSPISMRNSKLNIFNYKLSPAFWGERFPDAPQ